MTSATDGLECICDTCAGDGSICYMVGAFYAEPGTDFSKVCNRYRKRCMTQWKKLFGTPERAARTLARMCSMSDGSCAGCPMFKYDIAHCKSDYSNLGSIVEWLESEACDD